MADVFTKEKRSWIMSRIRGQNTKLETDFLRELSAAVYPKGYRYRKHHKKLLGKPDIVFVSRKIAIFLDGDFWHGRNYAKTAGRLPAVYWRDKIKSNIARDRNISRRLRKEGWRVMRFWETDAKKNTPAIIKKVLAALEEERAGE